MIWALIVLLLQYSCCSTDLLTVLDHTVDLSIAKDTCIGRDAANVISNSMCYSKKCGIFVADNLFADDEANKLLNIAKKGMAIRESVGGPTILDINTGYIRDTNGLDNLFTKENLIFDKEDFSLYGSVINKLKQAVENKFNISHVFFTAPTFITRLDGRSDWEPQGNPLS